MPVIVLVLPVSIFNGTLVRLSNANDHVLGVWLNHLVVTTIPVVSDQIVIVPVMV